MKYIAFLRGINVGGNKQIKMDSLKRVFESLGFVDVKTLLASGNVIFSIDRSSNLKETIEAALKKAFTHDISVILRDSNQIQELIKADPFKTIQVTPQTRLYVTFFSAKTNSTLKIPYESPEKDFRIVRVTDSEACSVLTLSPNRNTTDLMGILEKEYGKQVTTRSWNTVLKVAKAMSLS